jgi:RNA polymerase sigma factor (sigma-70 family)
MQEFTKKEVSELFLAQQERLCRHLRRRLSNEIDARDLAQETYLRMLRASDRGLVLKHPRAYLYRIANNLVSERFGRELPNGSRVGEQELLELESPEPSPEERTEKNRQLELIEQVLEGLSPKCRAVVTMRSRHGMTNREVAERLGISIDMVKKYMKTAMARCRKQLRRYRD